MKNLAIERIGLLRTALEGQVAVVTGAGRGIGRETARSLAWLGAQVAIAEISPDGLETEQLIRQSGGQALYVQADVSSPEDVTRLERAGFIQPASPGSPTPLGPLEAGSLRFPGRVETAHQGSLLVEQLQKVFEETGEEFNKLPVFIRPMARAGLKNKSGQSLQDWVQTARIDTNS